MEPGAYANLHDVEVLLDRCRTSGFGLCYLAFVVFAGLGHRLVVLALRLFLFLGKFGLELLDVSQRAGKGCKGGAWLVEPAYELHILIK